MEKSVSKMNVDDVANSDELLCSSEFRTLEVSLRVEVDSSSDASISLTRDQLPLLAFGVIPRRWHTKL